MLDHLRAEGVDPTGWRITLVTNLRVLGYVFNPASFYLCRDGAGILRVVVVEVHNTHWSGTCTRSGPRARRAQRFAASMEKDFYVSPFIDMEGRYTVRVEDEPARLRIAINERQGGEPLLATSLVLERRRLTDRTVLRGCCCGTRSPPSGRSALIHCTRCACGGAAPVPAPRRGGRRAGAHGLGRATSVAAIAPTPRDWRRDATRRSADRRSLAIAPPERILLAAPPGASGSAA